MKLAIKKKRTLMMKRTTKMILVMISKFIRMLNPHHTRIVALLSILSKCKFSPYNNNSAKLQSLRKTLKNLKFKKVKAALISWKPHHQLYSKLEQAVRRIL